jgi:hypothetical protein
VNDIPSKQYPKGSILGIPSDCRRADSTRRSLYQVYAALGRNFDLPSSWHDIAESHFADDHSVASFTTTTCGENGWEDQDTGLDTASLACSLKRKRTESDGAQTFQDFLFDQAASRQLIMSPQSVRASAFFQASQATLGPIVEVCGTRRTRARTRQTGDKASDEELSRLFAQDVEYSPATFDSEVRNTASDNPAPATMWAFGSDYEPEVPGGAQNVSGSTLSDDMFEHLWAYCPFLLHDPTTFESEACKTKRIAVSHVITHMIQRHRIIRSFRHGACARPGKYLVQCSAEPFNLRGCARCCRVASWTHDDLADNASHVGPAICLRCYEAFDCRKDLWFHLRHSHLCLDKGQLLLKSTKGHLLYKTFCSKDTSPSWIPPNSTQSRQSEQNGKAILPIADHAPDRHPPVPGPGFIVSNTPPLSVQHHGSHSDFSSASHTEWMLPSVHNSTDEWGADDTIGMPDLFGDEWMNSSTLFGNLSAGQEQTIIAGTDHYEFAEQAYEWQ